MRKAVKISFVVIISIFLIGAIGCIIFLKSFSLFETKEIELAHFKDKKTNASYKLNSFPGNATASSTLILYKVDGNNQNLVQAIETFYSYEKKLETFYPNDSTVNLVLANKEGKSDTFQVIFSVNKINIQRQ